MSNIRTPGPWRWSWKNSKTLILLGKNNSVVAEFKRISSADCGAVEALPELIEALEGMLADPSGKKTRLSAEKALLKLNTPWFESVEDLVEDERVAA